MCLGGLVPMERGPFVLLDFDYKKNQPGLRAMPIHTGGDLKCIVMTIRNSRWT
jgi:hypothetical protein